MASSNQADTNQDAKGKKPKKLSQKEQSERFIETARELGVEEENGAFEQSFSRIVKPASSPGNAHKR